MDTIAKVVREITDVAKAKDEYELKEVLILISDALAETKTREAKEFTKVLDSIISKIVEDGISIWDGHSIIKMLKTTEEWDFPSILTLKHIIWPENKVNSETYVAKSRRRFF